MVVGSMDPEEDAVRDATLLIDVDAHWTEPPDLWTARAPAALRDRVPRVARSRSGRDVWMIEGETYLSDIGATVVGSDGEKRLGISTLDRFELLHPAATDGGARLKMLDEQGVFAQVLYPNVVGFGNATMARLADAELREACTRIYNDAAAELQRDSGGRLLPQAVLPFWDIKDATRELERIRALGMTGIAMIDRPERFDLPPLADRAWDLFWATCQDLALPVNFHIGASMGEELQTLSWDPDMRRERPERWLTVLDVALFMENYRVVVNLIFSGLLDRFPRLNFVSVESGIGWMPFVLGACEYQFDELLRDERDGLALRPTDYFRRQIYGTFYFEGASARPAIDALGPGNVMVETDYPHALCLYPDPRSVLEPALEGLPPADRHAIGAGNAARLYGIELPEQAGAST